MTLKDICQEHWLMQDYKKWIKKEKYYSFVRPLQT